MEAIAKFVEETGRSPEDWFAYQRLNPSEMDDYSAVRVHMATEYSSLSPEEVNTLMQGKYKLNPDVYSQEEVKMGQLQLKMDAQNAKDAIGRMRDSYKLPVQQQQQIDEDPIITDETTGAGITTRCHLTELFSTTSITLSLLFTGRD